jgi:hypothetical protein
MDIVVASNDGFLMLIFVLVIALAIGSGLFR